MTDYPPTDLDVDGTLGMERLVLHVRSISLVVDDGAPELELHEQS
jgi:hypothetical protein